MDSNGNIEWSKTLGGPEHDFAFDCFETTDQHYFVGGNTDSYAFPAVGAHTDSFIALLDPKGKLLWTKAFFGAGTDTVTGIAPAADGGLPYPFHHFWETELYGIQCGWEVRSLTHLSDTYIFWIYT